MITGAVTHITAAFCALGFLAAPAAATQVPAPASPASRTGAGGSVTLRAGAHAAALVTHANPAIVGKSETEAYLVHPLLLARLGAWTDRVTLMATIDLEGWTLRNGELAIGNAGEGYVDRRHPHTFLHELVLSASAPVGPLEASLSVGRGFAPFGTDDPMTRPFVKYPANHHWSQILERLVIIAAMGLSIASIEVGAFNGDEPNRPEDLGTVKRFADSWAARATVRPLPGLEAQLSHARVESPEHTLGGGLDQRKWSASARLERDLSGGTHGYALLEWAETQEFADQRKAYIFTTLLAEAAWARRGWGVAARFERTTRPEEQRLFDPYRSARPHGDENIIGATRWNTITVHAGRAFALDGLGIEPFAEVAFGHVREITGAIFDPLELYGSDRLWNLSLGTRLRVGAQHTRMGRYGFALPASHVH